MGTPLVFDLSNDRAAQGVVLCDQYGNPYNSTNSGLDVNIQDQHSDVIIMPFNKVLNSTTLNGAVAIDDHTLIITDNTGIVAGLMLILFDPVSVRFGNYFVVSEALNVVTLDRPIDFAYPDGTYIDVTTINMNLNGSVTHHTFGIRGAGIIPGVDLSFDVTKINLVCETVSAVSLEKFGDLTKLINGIHVRTRNGTYKNLFNLKSNGEILAVFDNWTPYVASVPEFNVDGFSATLTFAGQNKIGVTVRLPIGSDLEMIIHDDLSGITQLVAIAEGHKVE